MKTWLRWVFHLTNLLVGGSGVALAVMIYLTEPVDEWSVVNHPWQPFMQHAHVLAAPLMVFVFGVIWARHVLPKWESGSPEGKKTGLALLALTAVMAASGYLLQVAVEPLWRDIWAGLHVTVSLAWFVVFVMHVAPAVIARRRSPTIPSDPSVPAS